MAHSNANARKAVEIFRERERERLEARGEEISVADLKKVCASKWKGLSEEQKKTFYTLAEEEEEESPPAPKPKARKRAVKKSAEEKENDDESPKPKKKAKDPNAPKRNLTSFFQFSNEQRSQVKADNPDFKVSDVAKELGKMWKELDPQEKVKYENMAKADKVRYEKALAAYENSAGA